MLVVYNGCSLINMDNVTRATVECKTISFYLNSGETYHLPFDTEEIATKTFKRIIGLNNESNWININNKGEF